MVGIGLEYKGVSSISGPIIMVENVKDVGYDELVSVKTQTGEIRLGKVIQVSQKAVTVQVFEGTTGLSPTQPAPASSATHWRFRYQLRCWDAS
jgi:V/A-type H+-transporting ATPase subunit B